MEYPLLSDIPRSKLWVSFLFSECRYKKKKFRLSILVGYGYVSLNWCYSVKFIYVCHLPETSLSLGIPTKVCRVFMKKFWKNIENFCSIVLCFMIFFLMLQSQLTSVYLLDMLSSHFYIKVNEEMIFLNDCFQISRFKQVWGWLTPSITSFIGYQGSQQIVMWWMDGSQRIIDPLYEGKQIFYSNKVWLEKGKIPATLLPLWETLWPASNKIDVMKFKQSIMTWYMNFLALSYPLQYAK